MYITQKKKKNNTKEKMYITQKKKKNNTKEKIYRRANEVQLYSCVSICYRNKLRMKTNV